MPQTPAVSAVADWKRGAGEREREAVVSLSSTVGGRRMTRDRQELMQRIQGGGSETGSLLFRSSHTRVTRGSAVVTVEAGSEDRWSVVDVSVDQD